MRLINYKSDFDFLMRVHDRRGQQIDLTQCDWEARFHTSARGVTYTAMRRGGALFNCVADKSGAVRVVCDAHGLPPGRLQCELTLRVPDPLYPDGLRQTVTPDPLDITLVDGKGDAADSPDDIELEMLLPLIKGDPGDPLTWEGMTDGQRAEFIRAVAEAVPPEAEPETITEEQIRALIDGAGNDNNNQ